MFGDIDPGTVLKPAGGVRLTAYNGQEIKRLGPLEIHCRHVMRARDEAGDEGKFEAATYYVMDVPGPAVVGLPTSRKLKLVIIHTDECNIQENCGIPGSIATVNDLKRIYPGQLDTIGRFASPATLHLKEGAHPFIDPPRKCSIVLREQLKQELLKMESQGIIRKVMDHVDWCSSLTYATKKDGTLRICLDPQRLNDALKRCPHQNPTLEELNPRFSGARVFSRLDAKAGYWAVPLAEESQILRTFRTPFGCYCWCRLPFGLKVSQDIFQQRMNEIIEGLPGVTGIADDVCVFGVDEADHDRNLIGLMERAQQKGLVFNSSKCEIRCKKIPFFGNVYTADGIIPDPENLEDIRAMPEPGNKEDLHRFIGIMTYLAAYIPDFASIIYPLRELLRKDMPWTWNNSYAAVFTQV